MQRGRRMRIPCLRMKNPERREEGGSNMVANQQENEDMLQK